MRSAGPDIRTCGSVRWFLGRVQVPRIRPSVTDDLADRYGVIGGKGAVAAVVSAAAAKPAATTTTTPIGVRVDEHLRTVDPHAGPDDRDHVLATAGPGGIDGPINESLPADAVLGLGASGPATGPRRSGRCRPKPASDRAR
jgi:hypothetical protein